VSVYQPQRRLFLPLASLYIRLKFYLVRQNYPVSKGGIRFGCMMPVVWGEWLHAGNHNPNVACIRQCESLTVAVRLPYQLRSATDVINVSTPQVRLLCLPAAGNGIGFPLTKVPIADINSCLHRLILFLFLAQRVSPTET
jgi:hypothetical protein